jgi:hypothetical protein
MLTISSTMGEEYWDQFELQEEDIEFLYNYLLEVETPLTSEELISALVDERIHRQKIKLEKQRMSGGDLYQPKGSYAINQKLVFPAMNWRHGEVIQVRPGQNPALEEFQVIQVAFEDGSQREFASSLEDHKLNDAPKIDEDFSYLDKDAVIKEFRETLVAVLEEDLETNPDFVRIAGRWFPRALLVDIHIGHLNLAEAILDMAGGGPLSTTALLEQIDLSAHVNPKLIDFSLDLALQEDPRFDEVGPAGDVLWFLHRLEPEQVKEPPLFLRYAGIDYDRSVLTPEMIALEQQLDDELSPISEKYNHLNEGEIHLIFPHWRSGTLPLSARIRHLFPTAYEAPRIRFTMVDGVSGEKFPGWVVQKKRYVYGLTDWYESHGVIPGSIIQLRQGEKAGEVIIQTDSQRSNREWIRTVLVGSDGGIVFAMLKQILSAPIDERMAVAVPDQEALDPIWNRPYKEQPAFERLVINTTRELAKLNPQSHVHASELYAAINITRRCPPGPILALLASSPWFAHVGDLHYRLSDSEPN